MRSARLSGWGGGVGGCWGGGGSMVRRGLGDGFGAWGALWRGVEQRDGRRQWLSPRDQCSRSRTNGEGRRRGGSPGSRGSAGVDLDLAQLPQPVAQRRRLLELEALGSRPHLFLEPSHALGETQLEPRRAVEQRRGG